MCCVHLRAGSDRELVRASVRCCQIGSNTYVRRWLCPYMELERLSTGVVTSCTVLNNVVTKLTLVLWVECMDYMYMVYRIAGKFGGELNLAVWRFAPTTVKLKSANISYTHIHVYAWRSRTEPPNLNPPIFSLELILGDPPNLIPAKFSSYTVG